MLNGSPNRSLVTAWLVQSHSWIDLQAWFVSAGSLCLCDIAIPKSGSVIDPSRSPEEFLSASCRQFVATLRSLVGPWDQWLETSKSAFSSSACEASPRLITHLAKIQSWWLKSKVTKAAGIASRKEAESQPLFGSERRALRSSPQSRSGRTSGFSASVITNSRISTVQAYIS